MYNQEHWEFDTQYNHKFGFHISGWSPGALEEVLRVKPKVVKVLDPNPDSLIRIKEEIPDVIIIYRQFEANQYLGATNDEAYQAGRSYGAYASSVEAARNGLIDLIESYNERLPESASDQEHALYNSFMVGFADIIRAETGCEPIWGNFATGNLGHPDNKVIERCYSQSLSEYNWLGVHEYDFPTMDRIHNQGLQDGNEGMWLALRYRRMFDQLITDYPGQWSVIVTECGMTQGVLGGNDLGPWSGTNTIPDEPWKSHPVPILPDAYWETLQWYNDELMEDHYVAGACLFITGGPGDWSTFEHIPPITDKIFAFQEVIDVPDFPEPPDLPDPPPDGDVKTQIYFNLSGGEYVAIDSMMPRDLKFNVLATNTNQNEVFMGWIDHMGNRYLDNPLTLDAGFSATLTAEWEPEPEQKHWWPYPRPLVGLHGRNAPEWHEADYDLLEQAKIETVSFMGNTVVGAFAEVYGRLPGIRIITRLYDSNLQNTYFNQGSHPPAEVYANTMANYINHLESYCQVYRIHNEPNHVAHYEGWGIEDSHAQSFNLWFIDVVNRLRNLFPHLKFLFPNLAQGDHHNDLGWITNCSNAIAHADGYCSSLYWQNPAGNERRHLSEDWGLRFLRYEEILLPLGIDRLHFIAEAGNSNHDSGNPASEEQVAQEITEWYRYIISNYSDKVCAMMPFLMSDPGEWGHFSWRTEDGHFKQVVAATGNLNRSIT